MTIRRVLAVGIVSACGVASGFADVAYSNFGPNYGYNLTTGMTVCGPQSANGYIASAVQFVATASGTLDYIMVPFGFSSGTNDDYVFSVLSDNANTPGTVLDSTESHLSQPLLGTPDLTEVDFSDTAMITAGQTYWVTASTDRGNNYAWNDAPKFGNEAQDFGQGYLKTVVNSVGAVEVDVDAVPEPGAFAILGFGVAAIGLIRSRR